MRRRLGRRAAVALAMLFTMAACGGGGGGGDGPDATATPVLTPTPAATPAGTPVVVAFTITATTPLQGVQLTAFYPTAKGGFAGSGDQVICGTPANGTFTQNDRDDGTLILSVATADALIVPFQVRCTFSAIANAQLTAADIGVMVDEVTSGGIAVDPASASVTVTIL